MIDFGMSVETNDVGLPAGKFEHAGVTALYRPLELWVHPLRDSTNCFAVDAWSFGCVMAEVFSERTLFPATQSDDAVLRAVKQWAVAWRKNEPVKELVHVPPELRCVVWRCCAPEALNRPRVQADLRAMAALLPPCPFRLNF